uniref:Uncharacterized protein n=1 Tax=viral metagenome TaxID=1070528 RepID=A0A6H2A505_9ZZZZ
MVDISGECILIKGGKMKMTSNEENAMKDLSNLLNATSNLMNALLKKDKDSIYYWNNSLQSWKDFLNKKITGILEEMKKEEENILEEEKIDE